MLTLAHPNLYIRDMSEQEIKLNVPALAQEAIATAMRKSKAESISLRALYFDTADRQLAKAEVALRLRLEGNDWVQTLKMAGGNSLTRIELNHSRPSPVLDLSLYAGTAAEPFLTSLTKPLELRYETDVTRLLRKQRTRKGTVEIAYDIGCVRAGDLELPISEVEFELKSGDVSALFELSQRWLQQYRLILDVRTKSHRGDALANMHAKIFHSHKNAQAKIEKQETQRFWAERKAKPYFLPKQSSATQALCLVTEECFEQIALNASYLAEVDTAGILNVARPEHVHQLRIGMRRLISNWRLFNKLAHLPPADVQAEIRVHLGRFGATRDTDVMLATIVPPLEAAGMPHFEVEHYQGETATEIARDPIFQSWLIRLLEWVVTTPRSDPQKASDEASEDVAQEAETLVNTDAEDDAVVAVQAAVAIETGVESTALEPSLSDNDSHPASAETTSDSASSDSVAAVEQATDLTAEDAQRSNISVFAQASSLPTLANNHSATLSQEIEDTSSEQFADALQDWEIIPLIPSNQNRPALRKLLETRLNKWNKGIVEHWKTNDKSDIEAYHDLRKKIKRIRYGLNVYEALEAHANISAYVKRLAQAQEVFGQLNDYSTAHTYFESITQEHPEAWFAVGWLSAKLDAHKVLCDHALSLMPKRIRFA